mgnify:CR=1 FL=1
MKEKAEMALRDLPKKVRSLFTGWARVVVVVAVAGRASSKVREGRGGAIVGSLVCSIGRRSRVLIGGRTATTSTTTSTSAASTTTTATTTTTTAGEVLHDSLDASHASLNASYASLNAS